MDAQGANRRFTRANRTELLIGFLGLGMGLISQTRRSRMLVCSIFLVLNFFFEMGQRYKKIAVEAVPHWVGTTPALTNIKRYFLKGTFSTSDVVAACLGSATALLVAEIIAKQGKGGSDT